MVKIIFLSITRPKNPGKVIDRDADRLALRRRVRQQLGDIPVFFTLVEDEPIQTFWMRSPHLVADKT